MMNQSNLGVLKGYYPVVITEQVTIEQLVKRVAEHFPALLPCLAPDRLSPDALRQHFEHLDEVSGMFEGGHRGGRGDGYRTGQLTVGVRKVAVSAINYILGDSSKIVVDVLGGNGTLARTLAFLRTSPHRDILCCDIARDMVAGAYERGLAAWRQSADFMLLSESSADAVVFLYGTHHIPPSLLNAALTEAHRILKPGGRIIVQDFEDGSLSAQWFSVALHRYTTRGHNFRHFALGEFSYLLQKAGFTSIEEHHLYDPLEIRGKTPEEAFEGLYTYLSVTYELTPEGNAQLPSLVQTYGRCEADTWNECAMTEPGVISHDGSCEAVMPRMSLIAWGIK